MKAITRTEYECEHCGAMFDFQEDCAECESQPIREDKGVKPGDKVRVLTGDGKGEIATVEKSFPLSRMAVEPAWRRYWHTIAITVVFSDGTMRWLTFDEYEVVS